MRQGQQNRRGRGRNNNNNNSNNNPRKGQNPLTRSFESNGPDVKLRGTPAHIAEKYVSLARDALSSGDPVLAENYLQHAEHYNRIILTYREQQVSQGGEQGYGPSYGTGGQVSRLESGSGNEFDGGDEGDDQGGGSQPFENTSPRFDDRPQRVPQDQGGMNRPHSGHGQHQGTRERHFQDQPRHQNNGDRVDRPDRLDRPERTDRFDRRDRPDQRGERFERRDRMDRPERFDRQEPRMDRPERVERPERIDRPDRVDHRPERMDRPERPERMDRPDRVERIERPERIPPLPAVVADAPPRIEPVTPRRRTERPATDRLPDEAHEQPEFLRRSVRRPRRDEPDTPGEAPVIVVPAVADDTTD